VSGTLLAIYWTMKIINFIEETPFWEDDSRSDG
jgi:hypothetical protein